MVTQRIEKLIKAIVKDSEDHDSEGTIKFEGLGMILNQLGIFQNLRFAKQDKSGHSTLGINHMEAKPDRISLEVTTCHFADVSK